MQQLEIYFDCSSPWTYLGFERAIALFSDQDLQIIWKPILVGGLFNTINPSVYHSRENPVVQKVNYAAKDLQDWARVTGLKIGLPPMHPVNSVRAMRGAFVAREHDKLVPYAREVFSRYWSDLQDISKVAVLAPIVETVGLDHDEFFSKIELPEYKSKLRESTQELANRGGFGSPTLYLNGDDMYFGNDRLELILSKLQKQ